MGTGDEREQRQNTRNALAYLNSQFIEAESGEPMSIELLVQMMNDDPEQDLKESFIKLFAGMSTVAQSLVLMLQRDAGTAPRTTLEELGRIYGRGE